MAIPGNIIRLRHWGMIFTFITLGVSIFELIRYATEAGPLPRDNSYVFMWVLSMVLGSLVGVFGTFTLHKGMILAASIIYCCALAPITPNMIVLSQGVEYQYFIAFTIFMFLVGGIEIALYGNLTEELNIREAKRF